MTATIDRSAFRLTPGHHLILGILAARFRLAEHFWTFTKAHRRQLEALAAAGLVEIESGNGPGDIRASLTGAGKIAAGLRPDYKPPLQVENDRLNNLLNDLIDRIPRRVAMNDLVNKCHTCPLRSVP